MRTKLSTWMKKNNFTTTMLVKQLSVSRQTVSGWKRGRYTPQLRFALNIVALTKGDLQLIDLVQTPTTKKKV